MSRQLTHPLVSPILQGSLGNLCPLYIIAGDGEVLRDEIIYLAHKAANPKDYPTRRGVVCEGHRQRENVEKFQTPTKVHLQVFDGKLFRVYARASLTVHLGMCHVLTVFTFTHSVSLKRGYVCTPLMFFPDVLRQNMRIVPSPSSLSTSLATLPNISSATRFLNCTFRRQRSTILPSAKRTDHRGSRRAHTGCRPYSRNMTGHTRRPKSQNVIDLMSACTSRMKKN